MSTFALYGDSYIKHLGRFCHYDLKVPGEARFFTSGGMTAGNYNGVELQKLKDFNPDVCFVCLGGNDIRPDCNPSEIVQKILVVTDQMKESGVKKVFVAEISTRGDFRKVPGLFRLSAALTGGKAIDLINAACSEQGLLSLYQVGIPGDSTQARVGAVDSVSQRIIELYQPALLQQYVPLSVLGDGNCFYRSISRALCGHENLHILLRLKTAIEIIVNRKYYDTERRSYVDLIRDHRIIVSDYKKLVEDTVILGSYSEMMHIYALSAVLNTPIRSFYPPQIHPELASDAFSRMVVGRNVRGASSSNITIMWTQMCIPQNAKRFSPNHFVFLKEIGQSAPVQVVVVDDNEQEDIKIKENIRQKKKTQLSDSKSFKITAHSEQSEAETPGQIDIVTTSNNDSLSASTVSMPEPQVSCNFENSLSVQKLDDRHKNTNYGDEGNKLPLSNANAHDNNSSVYGKDDYSSICFTDLEEASDLSWKSEKTDETKDSKSETSEHNVSMQSGSDNEDEIVGFQSNNIDASDLKNECKGNIPNGKHLETDRVIDLLMKADIGLKSIPCGLKENVFFIIDNENNISKKEKDQKSVFYDDCGVWDSGSGMSPKTPYLLTCSGRLKKLYLRVKEGSTLDNHDEETERVYCFERQIKKKRVYEPLNPQPKQGEVVTVQRYYVSLSLDKSYKKRVTYLWEGKLKSKFALVEYTGKFPGLSAHGNTKSGDDEYIRTPPAVMEEMAEMLKTDKPSIVFNKLKRKYDEVSRPSSLHQIRNKKRREKMKETNNANGNNVADQIQALENLVSKDHHFVRTIIRDKNKTPTIILYNDEQILDVKNLCCTGQSVLGVDKTFNLCNMHVTVSCYKQRSVVRTRTAESPIFLGPIFIHDNSDFESFGNFFYHLKMKLIDSDLQNLVIGTDDEKAMVKAIKTAFPESTHVLCSRHLKQNVIHKLTDDAVTKSDRNEIVNQLFGEKGIVNADDTICFEQKCDDFATYCAGKSEKFLKYFEDRLKTQIKTKLNEPARQNKIDTDWTNNNSESIKKPKQNVRRPKTVSVPKKNKTKHSDSSSDHEI